MISNLQNIDANILMAMLRGLTHESIRLDLRLNDPDLDDAATEELGLYGNDLDQALSLLMDAYEARRKTDRGESGLTEIGLLLNYFRIEKLV
jgi:hypothetical protein